MPGVIEGAVVDQAQQFVQKNGGNILTNLISAPFRAIGGFFSGAFSGIFSGLMWIGAPLLGLFSFAPEWTTKMVDSLNNPKLSELVHRMQGATFGERLVMIGGASALLGGGAGGAIEAGKRVIAPAPASAQQGGGNLVGTIGTGLALAAVAAVSIGAVQKIRSDGEGKPEGSPATASQKQAGLLGKDTYV